VRHGYVHNKAQALCRNFGRTVWAQAQAQEAVTGEAPRIVRNLGSGGSPDLHLENFSVSNGGPDLIENASLLLASGRRYGAHLGSTDGGRLAPGKKLFS